MWRLVINYTQNEVVGAVVMAGWMKRTFERAVLRRAYGRARMCRISLLTSNQTTYSSL